MAIVPSEVGTTDVTPVNCFGLNPIGDNEPSHKRICPSSDPVKIPSII